MVAYLKIENPGVAPEEAFTLLGASTKRGSDNAGTIGKFGTGNKHGVAVLLRHGISPVVFAGNLKMEFSTKVRGMNDGRRNHDFNQVVVKFGGKDVDGKNRSSTEDLSMVVEHGADDWQSVDLALREFVSNSLDRAGEEDDYAFMDAYLKKHHPNGGVEKGSFEFNEAADALKSYRATATPFKKVVIQIVDESQVRAKSGTTRVFVPLTDAVLKFYNDLGKWFLHFSEPESLNKTILPKSNRNFEGRKTAVIYRRGVRVREFQASDTESLFDYNLENLKLDESRKVDDWYVSHEASMAIAAADETVVGRLIQSFIDGKKYWEHSFGSYGLEQGVNRAEQKEVWAKALKNVAGENSVMATASGGETAARKGYKLVVAPEAFVTAAEKRGLPTPAKVLSQDEVLGREVLEATPIAELATEFAWNLAVKYGVTNGRSKPGVKTFRKIMSAGSQTLGFYDNGIVHLNRDIAGEETVTEWYNLSQQTLVTALEEVAHHVTGATDNSRDFQDYLLNLVVYMAKELAVAMLSLNRLV